MQHILYAHASYFLDTYGLLALWSTQGIDRSHYQAKGAYFKNTQHGGRVTKSNALHEMLIWFYQKLGDRKDSKIKGALKISYKAINIMSFSRMCESRSSKAMRWWMLVWCQVGSQWVMAM